jgi:hypothetical protein
MLPKATYHVSTDNLFSSPNLFRTLREAGYGAIGTARPNCGISKVLKKAKESEKSGKGAAFQYNEVRAIFTIDGLVSSFDISSPISLTNESLSFLDLSNRLER